MAVRGVSDCTPTVLSVTAKLATPASAAVKLKSGGSLAWVSLLVKWTVPK
jgi:hypothetical protein